MLFDKVVLITLVSAVSVLAGPLAGRQADTGGPPCAQGLFSYPTCCATDVLGVASLDCVPPSVKPSDLEELQNLCAEGGKQAKCCAVPVVSRTYKLIRDLLLTLQQGGQGVLCQNAVR
jgi:hypothetical protein